MKISHFFIDRPIFAAVVSIVFVILGGVAFLRLPIAQYPEIAPPIITVNGQFPGASAETVAETVVAPIEQQINGVEGMLYLSSNSTADGKFSISVTFDIGTNLDIAQVQVQNRVSTATPRLPQQVQQIGVTVAKSSPDILMVVNLYSPDKSRDALFISNYANLQIKDVLTRIDGVGSIIVFGARDYAMQIWLDPSRLQSLDLTASDVTVALQGQNIQVASGVLNQPPMPNQSAFQVAVRTLGRLSDPVEFANIVVKQSNDAVVRIKDVARVELAAQDYSSASFLNRDPSVAIAVIPAPGFERVDDRREDPHRHGGYFEILPGRSDPHHRLRPHAVHPGIGRRGDRDDRRGLHPRRAGRDPFSADMARGRDPDRRNSGVADRHLLRDEPVRLHP
jgi:multidrug efflux pump subunit AcrB